MELNSLMLKFFCHVTWFDQRQNWRPCKRGSMEHDPKRFVVKINETYHFAQYLSKQANILR